MITIHPDRLYLTSTERLARDLHRRFRLKCLREGKRGWESPRAMSLNTWLARTWSESWPEEIPAPDLYRTCPWSTPNAANRHRYGPGKDFGRVQSFPCRNVAGQTVSTFRFEFLLPGVVLPPTECRARSAGP
ncbi:MAG: hypothetical protein JRC93_02860 [Deltaproteobacteria bacterium]|nr:hypothetical protein [Deltaproteobacteria bacterium]